MTSVPDRSRSRSPDTPIVVVSGLPRSGTSLAMSMLDAGGMPVVTDGVRAADESNPRGYFECERVKTLDRDPDTSWLEAARGRAIKIVSFLLRDLPDTNRYRVVFMHRDMREILSSQRRMLASTGASNRTSDDRIGAAYEEHLNAVRNLFMRRSCFDVLDVRYKEVLDRPREQVDRIVDFLDGVIGVGLDRARMVAVVDRALYRHRLEGGKGTQA